MCKPEEGGELVDTMFVILTGVVRLLLWFRVPPGLPVSLSVSRTDTSAPNGVRGLRSRPRKPWCTTTDVV